MAPSTRREVVFITKTIDLVKYEVTDRWPSVYGYKVQRLMLAQFCLGVVAQPVVDDVFTRAPLEMKADLSY